MAHDAVGDSEDARELLQRLRLGVEVEQVIGALPLVGDLVGEPAPSPDVVADPLAAALLHQIARTLDDLLLPSFRQLGIEHEQNFVRNHVSRDLPSSGLNRPRRRAPFGNTRRDGEAGSGGQCSIAPRAETLGLAPRRGFTLPLPAPPSRAGWPRAS